MSKAQVLKKSIEVLEQKQLEEEKLLRAQIIKVYESIKPYNLLWNAIKDAVSSSELKGSLIESASGLVSGYLSRKLLVRSSKNPLLRLAGLFVQYGVTNIVTNNSTFIKNAGIQFIDKLTDKFRKDKG